MFSLTWVSNEHYPLKKDKRLSKLIPFINTTPINMHIATYVIYRTIWCIFLYSYPTQTLFILYNYTVQYMYNVYPTGLIQLIGWHLSTLPQPLNWYFPLFCQIWILLKYWVRQLTHFVHKWCILIITYNKQYIVRYYPKS